MSFQIVAVYFGADRDSLVIPNILQVFARLEFHAPIQRSESWNRLLVRLRYFSNNQVNALMCCSVWLVDLVPVANPVVFVVFSSANQPIRRTTNRQACQTSRTNQERTLPCNLWRNLTGLLVFLIFCNVLDAGYA